ncbi:hypothetical protein AN6881.2 [Aspergillus nidulans FGSC A4]|uniref:Uncharacterized protein n=1 Tax=Emericella nidulans (strain FGSC A4 / ATCC 38163 / CBS 112.46 / NRRL 194 / M139) TaxID=227321 RepID=Q5AXU9_EMENI|nr:hypothetical protein [Aspergillus nidulans FGSC A4]EAA58280.1 hypothetical protein AN6881.2 [Aspergillus nidulans FGSC A4]CBF71653.1 TPA: conserved hypothetical protein [Aspergillus nidulans FGSC A4]|eukprot:XP_664485.1 hypothetical protein AN6881.2 [Aspergillus nidulans FGSC A4]
MNSVAQSQPQSQQRAAPAEAGPSTPSHTEEQKRHFYGILPEQERKGKSYAQWVREAYAEQYEKWMPWLEDQYLRWFGKGDNKASYVTKENLSKTKITGNEQINRLQDDANNLVGNQLGENGLLAPVGNLVSQEGINRAERGGKDENGSYGGPLGFVTDPVIKEGTSVGASVTDGVRGVGNSIGSVLRGGK